ncbi:RIO1 family regulatory kinase/ATPase [Caldivirga sp. UBA161]|uniref:RIO1 family regulatory kinase/ATPase domain-containing protein n=1 Tax=Caldivirga sp. UBA161 TaxID=1915569 RepID=UPI0025BC3AFB|nr:RIO1 family regulatory kinase/ATPase [Caldivirga sp. UBA161]
MSISNVVASYNELSKFDLRVLRVIEVLHRNHEYVPVKRIVNYMGLSEEVINKSISKMNKLKLLVRRGPDSVRLTFPAYDILSIHTMVKRGVISAIAPTPLGIGKESDVYAADSPSGEKYALKFHRIGRVSFRNTRKYRVWIGERRHVTWLYEAKISAHMEYLALTEAYKAKVPVPRPRAVTRHLVAMEYINGVELFRIKLSNPEDVLEQIILAIEDLLKINIIHGDLNEYNILVNPSNERITIIDWPQWMYANVKGSRVILMRDLNIILRYFKSNYRLNISIDAVMSRLTPLMPSIELPPEKAYSKLIKRVTSLVK